MCKEIANNINYEGNKNWDLSEIPPHSTLGLMLKSSQMLKTLNKQNLKSGKNVK